MSVSEPILPDEDSARREIMKKLEIACEAALVRAHRKRKDIPGAINWADLSCLDVEWYKTLAGDSGYRVVIEEAAPENDVFQKFIHDDIKKFGFDVDVVTEW